jgi:hypothetical protein
VRRTSQVTEQRWGAWARLPEAGTPCCPSSTVPLGGASSPEWASEAQQLLRMPGPAPHALVKLVPYPWSSLVSDFLKGCPGPWGC